MKESAATIMVLVLLLLPGCGGGERDPSAAGGAAEPARTGTPGPGGGQEPEPGPAEPRPAPPADEEPAPGAGQAPEPAGETGKPQEPEKRREPGQAGKPEKPTPAAALHSWLGKHGVHLDRENRRVWVEGRIQITNDYLEYLAVCRRGKDHESLLLVDCLPSALNAALIALGLEKGSNYSLKEKVPPPPKEEVEAGRARPYVVVHPEGAELYLTVEWENEEGEKVRRRAEELVLDLRAKKPLEKRTWIYFGSRMASLNKGEEPVFMADQVFNLVSVCYMFPGNHLITIRHENGMDQTNWYPNHEELPPRGTPVRLYFSLAPME